MRSPKGRARGVKANQSEPAASPGHNPIYRDSPANVRRVALKYLDELLEIYACTDPKPGPTSEKGKNGNALHAIRLANCLTHSFTHWAENHIAGSIYRYSHSQDKATFDCNSHANEHEAWNDAEGMPLTAEQYREYIATVLENSPFSRHENSIFIRHGWRGRLSDQLRALNAGEAQLTKPSRTTKQGRPYTLLHLRWLAVLHVHVLVGTGLKKFAAENQTADALALSVETLRAWEKQFLKGNGAAKPTLLVAQKLARHDLRNFDNPGARGCGPSMRRAING